MMVNGKNTGYVREVFLDQFPYFGSVDTVNLTVFGRGIIQFATGKGASAVMSQSDGKYRMGKVQVSKDEGTLFWYPTGGKLMIAGGDSGGPSFATVGVNRKSVLVGVHAMTLADYVPGKSRKGWDWVTRMSSAAYSPIKPIWPQILKIMGPLNVPAAPPEPFTGRHSAVFENTVPFSTRPSDTHHILYGLKQDGTLVWHRHIISGSANRYIHSWNPTRNVGTGWADAKIVGWGWKEVFKDIIAGGNGVFYVVKNDGTLMWYLHKAYLNAIAAPASNASDAVKLKWQNSWEEPKVIGNGRGGFTKLFASGEGNIYGALPNGDLMWYIHTGWNSYPFAFARLETSDAGNRETDIVVK